MADLSWKDAVIRVLDAAGAPMHYADIADAIVTGKMRESVGATPAISANVAITNSLRNDGKKSPFVKLASGTYGLQQYSRKAPANAVQQAEPATDTGLINAFGMYWSRAKISWAPSKPNLRGQQNPESTVVDFSEQRGVYLLHDGRAVIYVGRTTDQPLAVRLRQHVSDRLSGRWDRFSWFGTSSVDEKGKLVAASTQAFSVDALIATMEALLIEGLEPPQNRKRGDDFRAVEFLQAPDPEMERKATHAILDGLKARI